jgi:hypothetical protein
MLYLATAQKVRDKYVVISELELYKRYSGRKSRPGPNMVWMTWIEQQPSLGQVPVEQRKQLLGKPISNEIRCSPIA